jgi:hypothetical protein
MSGSTIARMVTSIGNNKRKKTKSISKKRINKHQESLIKNLRKLQQPHKRMTSVDVIASRNPFEKKNNDKRSLDEHIKRPLTLADINDSRNTTSKYMDRRMSISNKIRSRYEEADLNKRKTRFHSSSRFIPMLPNVLDLLNPQLKTENKSMSNCYNHFLS